MYVYDTDCIQCDQLVPLDIMNCTIEEFCKKYFITVLFRLDQSF